MKWDGATRFNRVQIHVKTSVLRDLWQLFSPFAIIKPYYVSSKKIKNSIVADMSTLGKRRVVSTFYEYMLKEYTMRLR